MKSIYSYFTDKVEEYTLYVAWFTQVLQEDDFKEVDKILFLYLKYCRMLSIPANRKYLEVYLKTELRAVLRKYKLRISGVTDVFDVTVPSAFEEVYVLTKSKVLATYDDYTSGSVEDDFKVVAYNYFESRLKDSILDLSKSQYTRIVSGESPSIVSEEVQGAIANVRKVYDVDKIGVLDQFQDTEESGEMPTEFLMKTGIPAIDDDYGGVFTRSMQTVAGQPGGGKTRFLMANYAYRGAVLYKLDVRVDSLELTEFQMKNILISIHIANIFKKKIPDILITKNTLTDDQRKYVNAARQDLFESGKYGKIKIVYKGLKVESMKEDLKTFFKLKPNTKLWLIDYAGRIESDGSTGKFLDTTAIIDKASKIVKDVAVDMNIGAVLLSQYNEAGIRAAESGAQIGVGHIQGGQAIHRDTDYDLAITFTLEQKAANMRMLSTPKVRFAIGFVNIPLQVDLGISRFTQISEMDLMS